MCNPFSLNFMILRWVYVYTMKIMLYGTQNSREIAKQLLLNQKEVLQKECGSELWSVRLTLNEPIKETSLIPLLRQSGIHGFRLVEV